MNSADERQGAPAPAAHPAPAPTTRDACLMFRDGRLIAVETHSGAYPLSHLVNLGLLSVTDRMILGQLAARVDKLIGQLE